MCKSLQRLQNLLFCPGIERTCGFITQQDDRVLHNTNALLITLCSQHNAAVLLCYTFRLHDVNQSMMERHVEVPDCKTHVMLSIPALV